MVRDAHKTKTMSDRLLNEHGIYIQPINYPTVDVGTERLRITPTPLHTNGMMEDLVTALKQTFKELS
jgi:5-aminolevulinate synthase